MGVALPSFLPSFLLSLMALAPAQRAQGPEGNFPHAQSAGAPGRPSQGHISKGGAGFMPGGASPEPTAYVNLAPGGASSLANAAASGESGGSTTNRQDGDFCDEFEFGPTTTFPAGMPPAANYSLIGAGPHDLGALIRGGASVPTPGFDDGASLQAQAILSSPMAHPPGYGVAFAVGSHGTVSPTTGAFVHPFTLLALPSYAQRMGLLVQLEYLSNAQLPSADTLPFGAGFVLSGHDFLVETSGGAADAGATNITLFRGDGHEARYVRTGGTGTGPWWYVGPTGAQDVLTAQYNAGTQTLTYTRTLRDGRSITYGRVGTFGQVGGDRYVRSRVVDGYGNQIQYGWLTTNGFAYLQTITDTRGVVVQIIWNGSPARVERMFLDLATAQVDPAEPGASTITQDDLEIDFTYDSLRRLQRIQWFPTRVTHDANADGRVTVAEFADVRPTVELEYESNGKLAKVWDTTIAAAPVLHLHMEYASSQDWGVRVVAQAEGGALGTSGVITHTFGYPTATSRTYIDPRGRTATLGLDTTEYRVTTVKMEPGPLTPRTTDDQLQTPYADHTELNWVIQYACCGLPSAIVEPTGRTFAIAWDGNALQQLWLGGYSLHKFEQDTAGRVVKWWPGDPAAVPTGEPAIEITYTDLSGQVAPTTVVVQSRVYTDPRTNTGVDAATATLSFESTTGRLTGTTHSGTGASTFSYFAGGATKGRLLLQSIAGVAVGGDLKVTYACDDLGRPSSVVRGLPGGERETLLFVDTQHRVRRTLAKAVAAGSEIASEAYRDRFGAVSLARRENRKPDGTSRTRPWLQGEVIRDALGRTVKTVRDAAAVEATQELPLTTDTTWYGDHRVHTVTPPRGGVTTYVWDGYGLLYKTLVVASAATTLTPTRVFYNKDAQVWATRNGLGQERKVDRFAATGLVSKVYDPAGLNRLDLGYDTSLRLQRIAVWSPVQGQEARVTVLTYDEFDRVAKISMGSPTNANSHRIHVYDLGGRLIEVGLQAHSIDFDYKRGFKRAFDGYGRLVWQRDRLSELPNQWNQVSFEYDATSGLPTKLIEREIEQVAAQFGDLMGTGHTTHLYETLLTHDLLDRVTKVEQRPENGSGTSVVHHYDYDSLGDLVRFEDALGAELRWAFDGLGNMVARTEKGTAGGEITTTTAIDFVTGVVTRTDAEGRASRFRHDKAWRLEKQELPGYTTGAAFSHVFSYDAASRLIEIVNGNGLHIQRSYDASGRMLEQWAVPPLSGHSEWATKEVLAYDEFGGLRELTTKAGTTYATQVVKVTQWQDQNGRTNSEQFDFGVGGLREVNSGYSYLDVNVLREDLLTRHNVSVTGVGLVTFQLDRLGRTWGYQAVATPDEFVARYRFVGGRVRERQQGNQAAAPSNWLLSTEYGWDPSRRLASMETKAIATGVALSRFDHEFDLEGHLVKRKHDRVGVGAGGGDWFKLDEYYRLASTKLGVDPSQFGAAHSNAAFDAITSYQREVEYSPAAAPLDKAQNRHLVKETVGGNTTNTTYAVNAASHRYDSVGGLPLTYDGEGNLVSDGLQLFVYDFKNRLSEVWMYAPAEGEPEALSASASRDGRARYAVPVERLHRIRARARTTLLGPDRMRRGYGDVTGRAAFANQDQGLAAVEGNLQLVAVYGYDAFNRRVVRQVVGQLGLYSTWDGWREVAEQVWVGSWFAVRAYVWGDRIDELIRYSRWTGSAWEHFHPQQDHQDSVDLLVGADGTRKEKCEYDPFGGVTVFTWSGTAWVNPLPASSLGNPYTYTGRRLDNETGLMYYRNRYYWPAVGRFVTPDPIGLWGDVHGVGNGYMYAGNSPAFLGDPLGLQVGGFTRGGGVNVPVSMPGDGAWRITTSFQTPIDPSNGPPLTGFSQSIDIGPNGRNFDEPQYTTAPSGDVVMDAIGDAATEVAPEAATAVGGAAVARAAVYAFTKCLSWLRSAKNTRAAGEGARATTPIGRRGEPLNVPGGTNPPTTIGGRDFTGHAIDQMQARGVMPSVVENAIQNGARTAGNKPGTFEHVFDGVRVITNEAGGVITVITR